MINPTNILTVLREDNLGNITNFTTQAADPLFDSFRLNIGTLNSLYIGYNKPITSSYIYITDGQNVDGGEIVVEYWDGTIWKGLSIVDQTQFFNRSGTISWTMPSDWAPLELGGIEQYYVCIYGTADITDVEVQYVGTVLSDDTDIALEFPSILQAAYYPTGQTSFMSYHITAKEYIVAELLRRGYTKTVGTEVEPINQWDILNVFEFRQASLYYALSQIFFTLSDNSSDNYWQKYLDYKNKYEQAMSFGFIRIDQDNDGQTDGNEKAPIASYRWVR
jgi:hypothetical protein